MATEENAMAAQKQYIVGDWSHIFDGESSERMTRIVLDAEGEKLLHIQVQRNRAIDESYGPATRDELFDVEDSLVNANGEVFSDPESFGLHATSTLPEWASS